jgi:Flp pilus assembly protein TadG
MRLQFSKEFHSDEQGSISVLISGLFLLVLILSIGIIDISDSYLAKRELIQIGEDAILVASHSLDKARYYSGEFASNGSIDSRVPIDCAAAAAKFNSEIYSKSLRKNLIKVSGWSCSSDQITASISSKVQAIVNFPILSKITGGAIQVNATIGATSELSII